MSGFAALTSTLIVSIVLSLLALATSAEAIKARIELSLESRYLSAERAANSCGLLGVRVARGNLTNSDGTYVLTSVESCAVRATGRSGIEAEGWNGGSRSHKVIELNPRHTIPSLWRNSSP